MSVGYDELLIFLAGGMAAILGLFAVTALNSHRKGTPIVCGFLAISLAGGSLVSQPSYLHAMDIMPTLTTLQWIALGAGCCGMVAGILKKGVTTQYEPGQD